MMGLVTDNQSKILGSKPVQTADHGLHAGGHNLLSVAVLRGTLNTIGTVEVLSGLLHQFFPVGENEHPLPVSRDIGKGNCLAQASGHLGQVSPGRLCLNGADALFLIWS